ncbi:MAG: lytic transglycosylase domain-containing protein [Deltaproteobacteria bacterium]|nr:lytic transglycosylase domain-containing protein [Deltaproteobacteria bacterium]
MSHFLDKVKALKVLLGSVAILAMFISCTKEVIPLGTAPEQGAPQVGLARETLGQPGPRNTDYQLPETASICGEILPLNLPSVRERLDYEFTFAVNHPAQVELWRRRALRFFPLIESSLAQAGLPGDLKYLAVAESDLRPQVVSPAGAAGLWQFIPSTARLFGLKVNRDEDQRNLPELLLPIGMKYLSSLYSRFGSWALAMAAYNAGEARIAGALSSQRASDYYQLNLPRETERYVYRIAAIKLVLEGASVFGFNDSPPAGLYQPQPYRQENVTFNTSVTWPELARQYGTDYKTLKLLNPHLASRATLRGGPYIFRVPSGV